MPMAALLKSRGEILAQHVVVEGGVHFAVRSAGLIFALVVIVFQDIGFVILLSLHHGRLILYPFLYFIFLVR